MAESGTGEGSTTSTADITEGTVFAPAANPGAAIAGPFVGLALLALAVVAIRDLLVRVGWLSGSEWLRNTAKWIADFRWWDWMWAAAIGAILLGLILLWHAVRPRRTTHVRMRGGVLWTRRGDVARRVSTIVMTVPGVEHATTVVGKRRAKVTVTAGADVDTDAVADAVTDALAVLDHPPRPAIRVLRRRKSLR